MDLPHPCLTCTLSDVSTQGMTTRPLRTNALSTSTPSWTSTSLWWCLLGKAPPVEHSCAHAGGRRPHHGSYGTSAVPRFYTGNLVQFPVYNSTTGAYSDTTVTERGARHAVSQDIAVVPFLVLLPLVEQTDLTSSGAMDLLSQLGPTALVTLGSLGLLLLGGRIILRRVFEARSQTPCVSHASRSASMRGIRPHRISMVVTLSNCYISY